MLPRFSCLTFDMSGGPKGAKGLWSVRSIEWLDATGLDLAHEREGITEWILELRQPQLHAWRPVHDVRLGRGLDASHLEGGESAQSGDSEIDGGAWPCCLARRRHADQQADASAVEEGHLRRRLEEERQTRHISIERNALRQIVDRYEERPTVAFANFIEAPESCYCSASKAAAEWHRTFDMSGGPKGAKRPLERPLDGAARRRFC